jgi:RNA polymerase sigma-70 factor (ECF subfamily)
MSLTPNGSPEEAAGIELIDGLYSYALVLTRNWSDAEDLVQETYVRALGALGTLRTGSNLNSWLFTILRNIWFNQLRQQRAARLVAMDGGESAMDMAETGMVPYSPLGNGTDPSVVGLGVRRCVYDHYGPMTRSPSLRWLCQ